MSDQSASGKTFQATLSSVASSSDPMPAGASSPATSFVMQTTYPSAGLEPGRIPPADQGGSAGAGRSVSSNSLVSNPVSDAASSRDQDSRGAVVAIDDQTSLAGLVADEAARRYPLLEGMTDAENRLCKAWRTWATPQLRMRMNGHLVQGDLIPAHPTDGRPYRRPFDEPADFWLLRGDERAKAQRLLSAFESAIVPTFETPATVDAIPELLSLLPPDEHILVEEKYAGRSLTKTSTPAAYAEELRQIQARQLRGYFTIAEGAQLLANFRRSHVRKMLQRMCRSILAGDLTARDWADEHPKDAVSTIVKREDLPRVRDDQIISVTERTGINVGHDLLKIEDIDRWLELQGVDYRFPRSTEPTTTGDVFMPLEHAATTMAHDQWPDTQANREWAIEVWRQKYPEQPAPLLNGRPDQSGFLAHARHDTEREIQAAIDALRGRRVLTLFSPNTIAPTLEPRGAMVSKDEIVRLMSAGEHLKDSASLPATEPLSPAASIARPVEAAEVLATTQQTSTVDRGRHMKREALISDNLRHWPTIERDLKDAAQNGLKGAAKDTSKVGWWWEGSALTWARARGKVEEASPGLADVMTRRIHRMD